MNSMDLSEVAYTETRAALRTILASGGSEWDLETALIQSLIFNRSNAVIAACIDEIIELKQNCGDGSGMMARHEMAAAFNERGLHARLERR